MQEDSTSSAGNTDSAAPAQANGTTDDSPAFASNDLGSSEPAVADVASVAKAATLDPAVELAIERAIGEGVDRILRAFEERNALDRFRENQVDRLHSELQVYKSDVIAKAVRPILASLVRLHDDMGKVLESLARDDPARLTPARLLKLLEGFRDDVEIALDHNGVKSFRTEVEEFDPKRHKVARTVETNNPDEVGRIAARLRPGFERGDAIIERERVSVYALASSKPAQEQPIERRTT